MQKAIIGKKIGMTQIFTEAGEVIPVSVIEAGPQIVTQIKTVETDGYNAIQVAFGTKKPTRVSKPLAGHFAKAGVEAAACSKSSISKLNRLPNSSPAWPSRPKCSRKVRRST